VFAVMHPPALMLPAFVLGLCTAFVYDKTRSLLAPLLTHIIYSAAAMVQLLVL
jgi:ABC-2 type transport system permease protein